MHHKHVIGAAGFFSLGALLAWAVTADKYDRKIAMAYRIGYAAADAAASMKLYGDADLGWRKVDEPTDPNQQPLPIEVMIDGEKKEVDLHSVDIHPGPNAWGETIHLLDVHDEPDSDAEPHITDETPQETRQNLQNIIDQYTANPDDRDEFVHHASQSVSDNKPPYVISREEYAYGEDAVGYSKITLTYYPRERVLLDDDNDPINDIAAMIGWRSLSNFGGESGDPSVVFVRNDRLLTDFEVVREDDAELPLHVKYGMSEEEFRTNKAAGLLKLRREDE